MKDRPEAISISLIKSRPYYKD